MKIASSKRSPRTAAVAAKMILEKKIDLKGVYIPVVPRIYNPILDELEEMGIKFDEKTETLSY